MSAITSMFKAPKPLAPVPLPDTAAGGAASADQIRKNLNRNRINTILTSGTGVEGKRTLLGGQ